MKRFSDGQWQIRRRVESSIAASAKMEAAKRLKFTELKANTAQYYGRGRDTEPGSDDVVLDLMSWKRSSFLDRQIQNFRFHGTLEKVIRAG